MSDSEVKDFNKDVLERSATIPVLVDFWAEWCAPCRILGPVLERVAAGYPGRVVLAKVDTDRNPELSMQYGIRGIPAVKLFVDGKVTDEFTGALPEAAVMRWLEKALPERMRKELDRAASLLAVGDAEAAERLAVSVLMHEPGSARAAVIAAHATVWKDTVRAAELVMSIEEHSEHFPVADAIRTIARMRALSIDPTVLPDGPSREHYIAGLRALAGCDFLSAVDEFLRVVRTDRKYDDDGARKACIAIFRLLGDEHEVTRSRRRDFSSALHS